MTRYLPEAVPDVLGAGELIPLSEAEVGIGFATCRTAAMAGGVRRGAGRFSPAGAQAKLALRLTDEGWALPTGREPTTHILKPAIPDLPEQDLNEHLTMRTAAALGLTVAAKDVAAEIRTDGSVDGVTPDVRAFTPRFVDAVASHAVRCLARLEA